MISAVILVRAGQRHEGQKCDSGHGFSGVHVYGAPETAFFDKAGVCHIFLSELWHASVGWCALPVGRHGDLKLTLFWELVIAEVEVLD